MTEDCECSDCRAACMNKPGWFKPGEAEKAAKLVGLSLPDFFQKSLAVDWYEGDPDIFVLAPATEVSGAGTEYPGDPRGECTLYEDGKCTIHAAKPFECRQYHHANPTTRGTNAKLAAEWKEHQLQIERLLGRPPISQHYTGGLFGLW